MERAVAGECYLHSMDREGGAETKRLVQCHKSSNREEEET